MLRDLEGVICFIDGILIYGNTQEDHDKRLLAVLNRLEKAGVTSQQRQVQIFTERSEIRTLGIWYSQVISYSLMLVMSIAIELQNVPLIYAPVLEYRGWGE